MIGKILKWTILAALIGEVNYLILMDNKGKEVARIEVPVSPTTPHVERPATLTAGDYQLPKIGQAGRPIQVIGPFDGDFGSTGASVGGNEAKLLAESPRKLVAQSPRNVVGRTEVEVKEGNVVAKGAFRNAVVRLTAPKTTFQHGEQTMLTVGVEGLEGLTEPVSLRLENKTPSVVNMPDGNVQVITIRPGDVQPGGTFTLTHTLTGISPGGFTVVAVIPPLSFLPQGVQAQEDQCDKLRKQAEEKEKQAGKLSQEAKELGELADEAAKGNGPSALKDKAKKTKEDSKKRADDLEELAKKHDKFAEDYEKAKPPRETKAKNERAQAEKLRKGAKEELEKGEKEAKELEAKAQKMKDEGVPDDDPNTPENDTKKAAEKLRESAKDKRAAADQLEKEARELRQKYRDCVKGKENK